MNYLTEIKLFYDWLETHELTPSAILLWHGLMFIANRAGWEQPLTVPLKSIEARTMMNRASIYRARKVLEESGILTVDERGSNRASYYTLLSFEDDGVLRTVSRSASQYETHSANINKNLSMRRRGISSRGTCTGTSVLVRLVTIHIFPSGLRTRLSVVRVLISM